MEEQEILVAGGGGAQIELPRPALWTGNDRARLLPDQPGVTISHGAVPIVVEGRGDALTLRILAAERLPLRRGAGGSRRVPGR